MPAAGTDRVAAELLATLNARVEAVTARLEVLTAELAGRADAPESSDRLSRATRAAADLGWLFSLLAFAGGADLYPERHEPRGLALTAELLRDTLDRAGLAWIAPVEWPRLRPQAGKWLCWAIARLVWQQAQDHPALPARGSLRNGPKDASWSFDGHPGPGLLELGARIEGELAGVRFEDADGAARLSFPAGWLEPRERADEARG